MAVHNQDYKYWFAAKIWLIGFCHMWVQEIGNKQMKDVSRCKEYKQAQRYM